MRYSNIQKARFLARPNRFLAEVELEGRGELVHVKNTGRCAELFLPDATVWLTEGSSLSRRTKYDLVTVERGDGELVNIDSQMANDIADEWLRGGELFSESAVIRREVKRGDSRFDFAVREAGGALSFLEVKGVTLVRDGIAYFPDAPTERGVKHVKELADCARSGEGAYILFVIQMKGVYALRPNDETHRAFGEALREAAAVGVKILALDCIVEADSVRADKIIPVLL